MLEGAKSLKSAIDEGICPEAIYVDKEHTLDSNDSKTIERGLELGCGVFYLASGVIERVSDTVTPQSIISIFKFLDVELGDLFAAMPTPSEIPRHSDSGGGTPPVVICIDVRDPGNAGTIIRSSAGAGASGVVFCEGCVDPYNPKTTRSSAGSIFQIPLVRGCDPENVLDLLRSKGYQTVGTSSHTGTNYTQVDLRKPSALFFGNESIGLPDSYASKLDCPVTIPLDNRVESLNVAIASSIVLFEAKRQRDLAELHLGNIESQAVSPEVPQVVGK